jgi:hypothetical protein
VFTENDYGGAMFYGLPTEALVIKPEPMPHRGWIQPWDCFGYNFSVTEMRLDRRLPQQSHPVRGSGLLGDDHEAAGFHRQHPRVPSRVIGI